MTGRIISRRTSCTETRAALVLTLAGISRGCGNRRVNLDRLRKPAKGRRTARYLTLLAQDDRLPERSANRYPVRMDVCPPGVVSNMLD